MNWDAISTILEAVGVIAIVISLLYLALQHDSRGLRLRTHLELPEQPAYGKLI
jgi:hypothetical protein